MSSLMSTTRSSPSTSSVSTRPVRMVATCCLAPVGRSCGVAYRGCLTPPGRSLCLGGECALVGGEARTDRRWIVEQHFPELVHEGVLFRLRLRLRSCRGGADCGLLFGLPRLVLRLGVGVLFRGSERVAEAGSRFRVQVVEHFGPNLGIVLG